MRLTYLKSNLFIDLDYLCFFGIIIKKIFKDFKIIKNKSENNHEKIIYENYLRLTSSYGAVILD